MRIPPDNPGTDWFTIRELTSSVRVAPQSTYNWRNRRANPPTHRSKGGKLVLRSECYEEQLEASLADDAETVVAC